MPTVACALPLIMVVELEMDDNFNIEQWHFAPETIEAATKFLHLVKERITAAALDSKDSDTPGATFATNLGNIMEDMIDEQQALSQKADEGLDPTPNPTQPDIVTADPITPTEAEIQDAEEHPDRFFIHESASQKVH